MNALTLSTHPGIAAIPADTWDALGDGNPFTTHRFLLALEESGSVGRGTGWQPLHVTLEEGGAVVAAAPLYAKSHSQGEYIFDHAWAEAYQRAGGRYYPKLQAAVPFTPVTGARLLARDPAMRQSLLAGMTRVAERGGASGVHVTFCTEAEAEAGAEIGFLPRVTQQFHWLNKGYGSHDDFLGALSSRKRKDLRKERARAQAFGGTIRHLTGDDLKPHHWDAFWAFYQDTGSRKWGRPYLTRAFFDCLQQSMRDDILLVLRWPLADRGMTADVDCPPDAAFPGERQDLEEMIGNLCDNAVKWGRSRLAITVAQGPFLTIRIEDDGPGMAETDAPRALIRGGRLDEHGASGSGLGLAIVADLAALHGGSLRLERAGLGGLAAILDLPA